MAYIIVTALDHATECSPLPRGRVLMSRVSTLLPEYRTPEKGTGYLAGEFPGGTTTVEGAPVAAEVRALWRGPAGHTADGAVCGSAQSGASGTWIITNLNENLRYDVVGRKEGFNDVIVAGVTPTSMVDITYAGAVVENETFTGAVGFLELVGGIPPYSVAAETPLPSGLFPIVDGHNLIIDGTTGADEVASFDVKVTSSNGAEKVIPLQLVVGFKAPANFNAETVVVDDVFSVSLTWEVTNSTQQIKVYRSATPFDLDDLPEPIATLSGTSTTYTDDDVIEDDHFYYMVTAISEQYELRSEVVVEDVGGIKDPHWDNVVSLLHFDGADKSTSFFDETGTVWSSIDAEISETGALFGVGAGDFTLPSARIISAGISGGLPADFTVEAWVRPSINGICAICRWTSDHQAVYISGGRLSWYNGFNFSAQSPLMAVDQWHHIAVTRSGSVIRTFLNGVISATTTTSSSNLSGAYSVGGDSYNQSLRGLVDEFRITKGVARYTENFTPPTKPFPNK